MPSDLATEGDATMLVAALRRITRTHLILLVLMSAILIAGTEVAGDRWTVRHGAAARE